MKKLTFLLLVLIAINQIFAQNIKIKGSDTVLPLTQSEAEEYMKLNKKASIMVTGGGSGVGLAALENGTTDIAQSSRSLKLDEKLALKKAGKSVKEVTIAYDALAVIVNTSNKITKLTREELEGIYTGKITNWKEVGGADMNIVVYSRETSSGTYEFFKEHVLDKKNYSPSALLMPATGAIVQSVSQTKGAIGYVGLAYVEKSIKALKVSYDQGKTYVGPSVAAAKNKTYPISRPLYYYYLISSEKTVSPFVKFVLSPQGQLLVLKTGYVPLK
ncbi:MAG: PstS family phosphate ABC transporter substrate-binding protein [Bacteroidota bacterium]